MTRGRLLLAVLLGLAGAGLWWGLGLSPGEAPPADPASARGPARESTPDVAGAGPGPAAPAPSAKAAGSGEKATGYEPGPEEMESFLRAAVEAHLPGHKLSSDEIARASDALLRLRRARQEIRLLEPNPENAERLRALREELGQAVDDFSYVLEMSPAEFTSRVQPGVGVDQGGAEPPPADDSSEPVYLNQLPPRD